MSEPVLKADIDELRNSLAHLERSNKELLQAIADEGPDPEFRAAVNENIVTIAKKRARLAALEEELRRMTGEGPEYFLEPPAVQLEEGAAGGGTGHDGPERAGASATTPAATGSAADAGRQGDMQAAGGVAGLGGGSEEPTGLGGPAASGSGAGGQGRGLQPSTGAAVAGAGEGTGRQGGQEGGEGVWL